MNPSRSVFDGDDLIEIMAKELKERMEARLVGFEHAMVSI